MACSDNVLMGLIVISEVFLLYMFVRNELVFKIRMSMLDDAYALSRRDATNEIYEHNYFDMVPSNKLMLYKFWVWPLSKFYPFEKVFKDVRKR